jgi:hypothetical protein
MRAAFVPSSVQVRVRTQQLEPERGASARGEIIQGHRSTRFDPRPRRGTYLPSTQSRSLSSAARKSTIYDIS